MSERRDESRDEPERNRWRALPPRIRPEDMTEEQPIERERGLGNPAGDPEAEFTIRHAGG